VRKVNFLFYQHVDYPHHQETLHRSKMVDSIGRLGYSFVEYGQDILSLLIGGGREGTLFSS